MAAADIVLRCSAEIFIPRYHKAPTRYLEKESPLNPLSHVQVLCVQPFKLSS